MDDLTLYIFAGLGFVFLLNILLLVWCFYLGRKLKQTGKQGKDSPDLENVLNEISKLKQISEKTFQKLGVIRFNPFSEVGGDQSFCIALLDSQNNGFTITSLYTREANRVFAKPIQQGVSKYPLSDEEKKAIAEAIAL
jgi:hypothetical protein